MAAAVTSRTREDLASTGSASIETGIDVEIRGSFRGPFDLLLAIVRGNRYPLDRLPLGAITRQFERYVRAHAGEIEDLDAGSSFFETASWLVLLKSRSLLPEASGSDSGAEPPGDELRRALLDHAQLRALGVTLGERIGEAGLGAGVVDGARREVEVPKGIDTTPSEKVPTVHDALLAARQAMAVARAHAAIGPLDPGLSVEDAAALLESRLGALPPGTVLDTREWLGDTAIPQTRVAVLLALLELARLGRLLLHQRQIFSTVLAKARRKKK
jgi:segregation and condensation protein A